MHKDSCNNLWALVWTPTILTLQVFVLGTQWGTLRWTPVGHQAWTETHSLTVHGRAPSPQETEAPRGFVLLPKTSSPQHTDSVSSTTGQTSRLSGRGGQTPEFTEASWPLGPGSRYPGSRTSDQLVDGTSVTHEATEARATLTLHHFQVMVIVPSLVP